MMDRTVVFVGLALMSGFPLLALSNPIGEPGPELWVDGPLDVKAGNDPRYADADVDFRGRQVYVWDDSPSGGASGLDVFMRVFDSKGTSLVGPVKANTFDVDTQGFPRVAVGASGAFLVVWQSFEPPEPDVNFERIMIRSQAYGADGQPAGTEQVLNSLKTLRATDVSLDVAALRDGGYVAVWESSQTVDDTDTSSTIQGRLVNDDGTTNGPQFQVNSLKSGTSESDPAVTGTHTGGFFATWARPEIHGREFLADASPVADQFQISTYDSNRLRDETAVAKNDSGEILAVWTDSEDAAESTEIRGRWYSSSLNPMGPDFRINSVTTSTQDDPQVAGYGTDSFFVIWTSAVSAGADSEPNSIEGRIVTGSNAFPGGQFLVNSYTEKNQQHSGMGGSMGRVAMAWFSNQNDITTQNLILGQFWNICGIFCDGFE